MQSPIAQAIALTIFGNDFLHRQGWEEFWPTSTVFRFCQSVVFVTLGGLRVAPREIAFAEDPACWFATLASEGVKGLRLHHISSKDGNFSDRMTVGLVGGGGEWIIESFKAAGSDLWEGRWLVHDQNAPDQKIWRVTYSRVVADTSPLRPTPHDLSAARRDLENALAAIESFAVREKLGWFIDAFRQGAALLHSDDPLSGVYHSDFARCKSLSSDGRQLLGALQAAWVFGGMGSWNDIGVSAQDEEEYQAVSDALFSAFIRVIVETANSTSIGRL